MDTPLISHPAGPETPKQYPADQLTEDGDLRLTAHNSTVADRASRLFGGEHVEYIHATAFLHDFGKATPQFQAHVRNDESYTGPTEEKNHARLGALAAWFILGRISAPDQDRLASTLAIARHHQALPNAADYSANTLADAFEGPVIRNQLDRIDETWPDAATELLQAASEEDVTWQDFYDWAIAGAGVDELEALCCEHELTGTYASTENLPSKLYDRTLHYWSAITLADKSHAMGIAEADVFDLDTLDLDTIERYIAEIRSSSPVNEQEAALNDERERARRQAIAGVHRWFSQESNPIATLTLPTGLGKTLTGLSAAFETRDLLRERDEHSRTRPIIYALPYTSIIEQTRALFENPALWGVDPNKSALTVHHYLSETVVYHDEDSDEDVDDADDEAAARLLGESWRDGTVLTTFVQLFESLTGPRNRQGLKLSALRDGLVILDEPQALPKDWWDGIVRLIELLTEEYGTRIIAMTATQPTLLRNLETVSLLVAGRSHEEGTCGRCSADQYPEHLPPVPPEQYFEQAERVRYTIDPTALAHQLSTETRYLDYETAAERVRTANASSGSTLAVCNTIESCRVLASAVCDDSEIMHLGPVVQSYLETANIDCADEEVTPLAIVQAVLADIGVVPAANDGDAWSFPSDVGTIILTINSRYRPFDRRVLIGIADLLSTSPVPFILISTQAIEAGVDLSFQTVFRDIAPVDSIVQAAGRCNRSYEWGRTGGRVVVWTLASPDEETPANPSSPPSYYVYEQGSTDVGIPGHLKLISDVLANVDNPDDAADVVVSRDAVDAYFEALREKSLWTTAIRDEIDDSEARKLGRRSLIGDYDTADVLVAVSDAEVQRLHHLTELFVAGSPQAYDELKTLSSLRTSIPLRAIENAPSIHRVDGKGRNDEGVHVFGYVDAGALSYELGNGGLHESGDAISGRFSVF